MIINFMEELNDKFISNNFVIWIGSKLSRFLNNKRQKPMSFDLLDDNIYAEQLSNAQKYEEKSKLGKYGVYGFGFVMSIIFIPDIFFNHKMPTWLLVPMAISIIFAIFATLIWARCPHCNSLQPGYQYSFSIFNGISASYGKGISPFAKRCVECDYYLSIRALNKDLEIQKEEKSAEVIKTVG